MPGVQQIDPVTASQWAASGRAIIIDVRELDEWQAERIHGAALVPLSRFDTAAIPEGKAVILQCRSGVRSMDAAQYLARLGRTELYNLAGGIIAWREAGLPVECGG
jgi:rhodanese-related sulfurtransferase